VKAAMGSIRCSCTLFQQFCIEVM